ncbi:hypothetical protein B0G83_12764 [Paraburkholderia sp. BL21I4N1]|nr:hypothetical protein B0G83_12764 [Paraburkholderia sp. BL21I4N1]
MTLRAKVRLVDSPACRVILVLGFADIFVAADGVPHYARFGPIAIEGRDCAIIRGLQARGLKADEISLLPLGNAWVVLEFGADTAEEARAKAEKARAFFLSGEGGAGVTGFIVEGEVRQDQIWSIRETGASAVALSVDRSKPDSIVGWEDAAVDPLRLGDYLRRFQSLVDRYGYETCLYGHFGDGCVHARITFDLRSVEGVHTWRRFLREAAELVVEFGSSLSGEHGDGEAKAEFLPMMYSPDIIAAMEQFKAIWDPAQRLNPGKIVNAYRADENLRMGPAYMPVHLRTKLAFESREGYGMQRAVERCIGAGKCRSLNGGTMCPSFRASREEAQSTCGRAHLTWETLQGEVIEVGWNSKEAKDALDTCLACKGCKSDCPTHTDMATYKAEFLSQYYERNRRPRQAMFMGRIGQWAPLARRFPWLTNLMTSSRFITPISRWVAGLAPQRNLPVFASKPFRQLADGQRVRERRPNARQTGKVILWVDTFNDHFSPQIASAAFDVLTLLGYDVLLPHKRLCCGRPLYDYGLINQAKALLRRAVDDLSEDILLGVPVVGLEPGCLSVFKDELLKQLPQDDIARKLSAQTHLLSDFLAETEFQWPTLDADVIVHGHCHQKSLFGMNGETALLDKLGLRWKLLDTGCCGMAGSFGFNNEHYDLSMKVAEDKLLPLLRAAPPDALIMTNDFSCREQIEQGVKRPVLHIAELALRALRSGHGGRPGSGSRIAGDLTSASTGASFPNADRSGLSCAQHSLIRWPSGKDVNATGLVDRTPVCEGFWSRRGRSPPAHRRGRRFWYGCFRMVRHLDAAARGLLETSMSCTPPDWGVPLAPFQVG